jgi:4-hydroxybenzoate polyprenyltransferase
MKLARALLVLGRVSNLPTIWSNCLCGWLIGVGYEAGDPMDWTKLALLTRLCAGATLLYLGGMFLNDACDVDFDREHRKERPIPSGAISVGAVWKIAIGMLAVGVGLLSFKGGLTALLALGLFNCIFLYNFIHKKYAWSPALIALCRVLLILLASSFAFDSDTYEAVFFHNAESGRAMWTALVLGLYVAGLSCLAKEESQPGAVKYWPCLLMATPIVLAWLVNPGDFRQNALLAMAILALWVLRSLRYTFWFEPRDIAKTVGGLLAGIVLVDLLAVAHVPPELGLVFVGLFVLSLAAQRWVPAT